MSIEKFPLTWPPGYPVTERREPSKFVCTFAQARDGIFREINLLGVDSFFISCNVQRNKNGDLVEGRLIYDNPGVALYFVYKGEQKVIACDKWNYIHENLRAIEKSVEAIRGLERWGCSDIISRAMGDMKALPQYASAPESCWNILNIPEGSPVAVIKAAYREKSKSAHPDVPGGSKEAFLKLSRAFEDALKSV